MSGVQLASIQMTAAVVCREARLMMSGPETIRHLLGKA
jgi:hypothetical protein